MSHIPDFLRPQSLSTGAEPIPTNYNDAQARIEHLEAAVLDLLARVQHLEQEASDRRLMAAIQTMRAQEARAA